MTSKLEPKSLPTIGKDLSISPEERAELESSNPGLLKAIEENSPVAAAWLASYRRGREDIPTTAQEQATAIREEVMKAPAEQESLLRWCGFPTDMTRVSPFFPMQPNELGAARPLLRNAVITSASWGEIRYTGPKLSVHEEDALLALLAILDSVTKYRKETSIEDRKTYNYTGPILPLWRLLYGSKTKTGKSKKPSAEAYKRLVDSLRLLAVAGVELSLSSRTKGGKRKVRYTSMSAMLANVAWDEEKKVLSATLNPFFYETYYAGAVTLMDVQKRMSISGSIAKCLYRFVQSHRDKGSPYPLWAGHFLTLAQALNMDIEQPAKEVRRQLKAAIQELIRKGVLHKNSGRMKDGEDVVMLIREKGSLPEKKRD